jgi:hypothetical protein
MKVGGQKPTTWQVCPSGAQQRQPSFLGGSDLPGLHFRFGDAGTRRACLLVHFGVHLASIFIDHRRQSGAFTLCFVNQ